MRKWMNQIGGVFSFVVALFVSLTAYAAPPQCTDEVVCNCTTSCDKVCYVGPLGARVQSTCGQEGLWCSEMTICGGNANSASLIEEAQAQQEASLDVCAEQVPQATPSKRG